MGQEPWNSAGPAGDQVRFGSSREPRPHRPRARYLAVAAVIAVAVAAAIVTRGHGQSGAAGSDKSPAGRWYAVSSSIAVKAVGHPLLG